MASAWGKSWGLAFGAAFGALVITTPGDNIVSQGGGGVFRDPVLTTLFQTDDAALNLQIQQEDEMIVLTIAHILAQGEFG